MRCPTCDAENPDSGKFCNQCGKTLHPDTSTPGEPSATPLISPAERIRNAVPSRGDDPEEEIWRGRYSAKSMMGWWLLAILVSLAGIVAVALWFSDNNWAWLGLGIALALVWIFALVVWASRTIGIRYRLTTQRFYHESGVLRHRVHRIEVIDMDDVSSEQSLLERLFGVGTVHVSSSDHTHPDIYLRGIEDPRSVSAMLDQARRNERMRRGIHIESV